MVLIEVPSNTKSLETWRDRLLEISVGHKIVINDQLSEPQLSHNSEFHKGVVPVNNYIKELETFMQDWCRCACED